jgi:hypothetical protein
LRPRGEFLDYGWPVVKARRIEIRSVRPYKGAGLGIQGHAIERGQILKRPKQSAVKHWPKIDVLLRAVGERHREPVRPDYGEPRDAVNRMGHGLPEGIDLDWRLAGLQELPVVL